MLNNLLKLFNQSNTYLWKVTLDSNISNCVPSVYHAYEEERANQPRKQIIVEVPQDTNMDAATM